MDREPALTRAINYFTLWELLGRIPRRTSEAWAKLKEIADVSLPVRPDDYRLLGFLDWESDRIAAQHDFVSRTMGKFLGPDDKILALGMPDYPTQLAETEDAPEILFVRGNVELLHRPAVAVVGTRHPSDEGRRRARKLGYLLSQSNIAVASGLALGIDEAAHLGTLEVGGDAIAVIGTPLHRVYPKEHVKLQEVIGSVGVVVSQFYPGDPVQRFNFPMRNAVMSGLCLGTIVVEAGETSGALIQARKALQQERRLFIPQSAVDNPTITWPERLLAKGALQFATINEVMDAIDEFLPSSGEGRPIRHDAGRLCSLRLTTSVP